MANLKDMFVDPNEQAVAVLGGSYLQNFLASGLLSSGFCVVSNRRVYFRGKCYSKQGNDYRSTKEERTVDLKDVTGTGFTEARSFMLKIIAIVVLVLGLLSMIISAMISKNNFLGGDTFEFFLLAAVLSGTFWLLYFLLKEKVFEIEFAGGRIAFLASSYSMQEMQIFQKSLRAAKDNYMSAQQYIVTAPTPAAAPTPAPASTTAVPPTASNSSAGASVADELKKLKNLLDAGAITQEEFDTLKANLLK